MENGDTEAQQDATADYLAEIFNARVTVKLNSGIIYRGILQSVDGYMNVALEECKEYVDGELGREYGDAFVRGNNVLYIAKD